MKKFISLIVRSAFSFALTVAGTNALGAGNVSVSVVNDELRITGDSGSNQIEIEQTVLNRYRVKGLNGTKINGRNDDAFRVKRGIVANMNGGDDKVTMAGESLGIFSDNVDGILTLNMGNGSDTVDLKFLVVDNNISINMGQGIKDTVSMFAVASGGSVAVVTGSGDDQINLQVTTAENSLSVASQSGDDEITLNVVQAGFVTVNSGSNDDDVDLTLVISDSSLEVETEAGDDLVKVAKSQVAELVGIATGDDDDEVTVDQVVGQELFVLLGEDDDLLILTANEFEIATVDGEGDSNLLQDAGDNDFEIFNEDNFDN